jgi:hypothetical protein
MKQRKYFTTWGERKLINADFDGAYLITWVETRLPSEDGAERCAESELGVWYVVQFYASDSLPVIERRFRTSEQCNAYCDLQLNFVQRWVRDAQQESTQGTAS